MTVAYCVIVGLRVRYRGLTAAHARRIVNLLNRRNYETWKRTGRFGRCKHAAIAVESECGDLRTVSQFVK